MLDAEKFAERFTFEDVGGMRTTLPLREMSPVEVLRAWRWHSDEAHRICETHSKTMATDAEIATVKKAQRLWDLIEAAMPDWPDDGMVVGAAVHRYWPGGRPAN